MFLHWQFTDLQASENLINEELDMVISQFLAFHNVVEVCSH